MAYRVCTPIQKIKNPSNEDDLRIISLTNYLSKQFEQFVIIWLLKYVGSQLDCGQYGGVKGSSISHYLINFINFILFNQDLAVMIDFSKAFNRINHNTIITILSDMGVPGWLLNIVIAFLTDRELILRYNGMSSKRKSLPGGGPQGTKLGLFLFLILINAAGYPHLEKNLGLKLTRNVGKRAPLLKTHMKYVDDLSLAQAIDMKECLIPNPNPIKPQTYHDRTNHILPSSSYTLQDDLNQLVEYSEDHEMRINKKKCKVMLFNTAKKYDGLPTLTLPGMGQENLEVVEKFKLLGVIISSDLKWNENTKFICKKGYERLWMLRRLKKLGASKSELLDVYERQIRSVLELAVPAWQPGLTKQDSNQIERIQKTAFYIILGQAYESYDNALSIVEKDRLSLRRIKLCEKFAKKAQKNPKFENWFYPDDYIPHKIYTRANQNRKKRRFKPVPTRTERFENSPVPYMTKLLNKS